MSTRGALNVDGVPRGGRARHAASSDRRWWRSPCAKACRRATTAGARVLWDGAAATLHQSQRYDVRLVDRIGGGDSFAAGLIYALLTGRVARRCAALRRRRQRAEADDSRRLQSRHRGGSRCARQGRRLRPRPALTGPRAVGHGPFGLRERGPQPVLVANVEKHSLGQLTSERLGRQVDDEERLLTDER